MSQKSLSTRSLLELIDLFEGSIHAVADGGGQRLRDVPGWDLSRRGALSDRDLAAWTERIGYADSYPATSAIVLSSFIAAKATLALNPGEWLRRVLLLMSAPDLAGEFLAQGSSLPTYRRVQFCRATS